jgi:copper chaperone CopZ
MATEAREATEANHVIDKQIATDEQKVETATFAIEGMSCATCSMRIEKGLKKVPGVLGAQVNLATELGTVTYDPTQTGVEQMMQKVEKVGYKASPVEQSIGVSNPTEDEVEQIEWEGAVRAEDKR